MQNPLIQLKKWFEHNPKSLISLLLIAAISLRALPYQNIVLGFDQVQIVEAAHRILQGDITLIGPRTGPAQMFTGPIIYYASVPFIALFGEIRSIVIIPLLLSLLTGISLLLLVQKYTGKNEALLALTLWAFSPMLINLDRVFWNPNLTLLASALLFIPLMGNKKYRATPYFLFLGAFLSYQAHFSGFMLVALSLLSLLIRKKPWQQFVAVIVGLSCSLLPTVLFDLRNNFLNLNGLITLLSGSGTNSFSLSQLPQRWVELVQLVAEVFGMLFMMGNSHTLLSILGAILVGAAVFAAKRNTDLQQSLIWIAATTLLFTLYSGSKPEYYFLFLVPAFLHISWYFFPRLGARTLGCMLVGIILYSTSITYLQYRDAQNLSLRVLSAIHEQLTDQPIKTIIYDIPLGNDFGVRYYLKDIALVEDGAIVHISYPNKYHFPSVSKFGNVGVWFDPRVEGNKYITTESYIIGMGSKTLIFSDDYLQKEEKEDAYKVLVDGTVQGSLSAFQLDDTKHRFADVCQKQAKLRTLEWTSLQSDSYLQTKAGYCLQFTSKTLTPMTAEISLL